MKGDKAVRGVHVQMVPGSTTLIRETPFPVSIVVSNDTDRAIEVPESGDRPPLAYLLLSPEDGSVLHVLSAATLEAKLHPHPEPVATALRPLAPRAAMTYEDDVAARAATPLPPGEYLLAARCSIEGQLHVTQSVGVKIVAPHVAAFACLPSPGGTRLATAYAHEDEAGARLFHRESAPGNPDVGVAYLRYQAGRETRVGSVALSAAFAPATYRWIGWLEGGVFRAAVGQEHDTMLVVEPCPTRLSRARLLECGCQFGREEAVFLVAGLEEGTGALKSLCLEGAETPRLRTFELAPFVPDWLAARYVAAGDAMCAQVVWVEPKATGSRVLTRTIRPTEPDDRSRPVELLECEAHPLAMGIEPAGRDAEGTVDLLFGPAGEAQTLSYCRIDLSGGGAVETWAVAAPVLRPHESILQWKLADLPAENPPILAVTNMRVLFARCAREPYWMTVAERAEHISHACLLAPGGADARAWAVWVDTDTGIEYRRIP